MEEFLDKPEYEVYPHLIPEHRDWVCRYIGVMGEVIKFNNLTAIEKQKKRLRRSFYGREMHIFEDEKDENGFSFGRSYEYTLILYEQKCWVPGCGGNYFIFDISPKSHPDFIPLKKFMVVFNTGGVEFVPNATITYKKERNAFIDFLTNIYDLILNYDADEIVLCGHSNGMSSATFTAFLLIIVSAYIENNDSLLDFFYSEGLINKEIFNLIDVILEMFGDNLEWLVGIRNKLVVCGTGGFPILFQTFEQFSAFTQEIGGRYIHIGLGYGNIPIEIDPFMAPLTERFKGVTCTLYNFIFYIYTYPEHPSNLDPRQSYYAGSGDISRPDIFFRERDVSRYLHEFELYRRTLAWHFCR